MNKWKQVNISMFSNLVEISFAQWRYHSQWGSSEAWLLLVENYTQYPAPTPWNMGGERNLWTSLRGLTQSIYSNKNQLSEKAAGP